VGLADVTRVDEARVLEVLDAAEVRGVIIADDERVLEAMEDERIDDDDVEDTLDEEELPPVLPPQPSWMLLNCHVAVVLENPDQTKAVIALALAPEKDDRGMFTVCVDPVNPVTEKNLEV
jgi:hypothetical protein